MSLFVALLTSTPWYINATSVDDGSVLVDLTTYPGIKDGGLFVMELNKTRQNQYEYEDYHGDGDKPARYLYMTNATETFAEVSGIPVYSLYDAVVYFIGRNHDIFKTEIFQAQTVEGGEC